MNRSNRIDSRYDAVVVGARVAGASTAMLLARAGMRVLVVDKSAYRSDTTSTHAIMRAGVMQLHRWGLLERIAAAGTPAIRRTTFHYGTETVVVDIKPRDGIDALYSPRRTVIDAILADAAAASGARVEYGVRFEDVLRDASGRVCGVSLVDADGEARQVEADVVIGADGMRSRVAHTVGAGIVHEGQSPASVIYQYMAGLELDGTHWYYNDGVAAGVIPTNDGEACVFAGMSPGRYATKGQVGLDTLFMNVIRDTDASLGERVARARPAGNHHPFAGHNGFIRRAWGPGWALVGDAGCFKDPITAHGMTDALRDAELVANAVIAGSDEALAACEAERDAFAVDFMQLSDRIASFDWTLESVKPMHRQLSRLMNAECDIVRGFEAGAAAAT
jgi:2-polyprenyl-6-methoxyphenol hydroxylase-like FAD-dependent oxidoreductase